MEIAWAGLTRLVGSNPTLSAVQAGYSPGCMQDASGPYSSSETARSPRRLGHRRRAGAVAAQALVAADDVAPLHQPHARGRVDLGDRRADQVAAVGLAAGAHLDLGGDLVRVAGRVLAARAGPPAWRRPRAAPRATRPTPAALASIRRPATWPSAEKQWAGGVALEAVDEPPLLAAADGEQACAGCRRSSIRPSSGTITAAIAGQVGQRPDPGQVEQRAARCRPPSSDARRRAPGAACARASSPPPSVPCFGVTLKAVWPGRTMQRSARV